MLQQGKFFIIMALKAMITKNYNNKKNKLNMFIYVTVYICMHNFVIEFGFRI